MAARNEALSLQDIVLTEAIKDLEAHTPLRDDAALESALAAGGTREAMLVARARQLAVQTGLDDELNGVLRHGLLLGAALAIGGLLLAGMLTLGLLGESRRINALAAMALVLLPNALGLVAWALFAALGGRGGAGAFGRALSWLARHRWAGERLGRAWPALARVLDARGLTAWLLGCVNHVLWSGVYALAAFALLAVFAFSRYGFTFETTILAPPTLHDMARALAWWPQQLGLPAALPEVLDESHEASQRLGLWLISGTLAWGAVPRLAAALLCVIVVQLRSRDLHLDLADPAWRGVLARLAARAPTQVIDGEQAAPAAARAAVATTPEPGMLVLIGFELPTELPLPPALLAQAAWSERLDGGLDERRAVLRRLADHPPARLLLACHAPSTPDRGTLRFLEAAHAGAITLLLLGDGTHAARWRQWLDAAGRNDIAVITDAEAGTSAAHDGHG